MCVSARPLLAAAMALSYTREQPFHLARLANPEAALSGFDMWAATTRKRKVSGVMHNGACRSPGQRMGSTG